MYSTTLSSTSALGGVGGKHHTLVALPPGRPGTHTLQNILSYKILCLFSITVLDQSLLSQSNNHHDPVLTHTTCH